jgi:hypothetical protein
MHIVWNIVDEISRLWLWVSVTVSWFG